MLTLFLFQQIDWTSITNIPLTMHRLEDMLSCWKSLDTVLMLTPEAKESATHIL